VLPSDATEGGTAWKDVIGQAFTLPEPNWWGQVRKKEELFYLDGKKPFPRFSIM